MISRPLATALIFVYADDIVILNEKPLILLNSLHSGKNWHALLSFLTFSKTSYRNTIEMQNSLDPDQGPNCFQRLSAEYTYR